MRGWGSESLGELWFVKLFVVVALMEGIIVLQVLRWIYEEFLTLAHDHTDIGDSLSSAKLGKQSFEDYQTRKSVSVEREQGGRREGEGGREGGRQGGRQGEVMIPYKSVV